MIFKYWKPVAILTLAVLLFLGGFHWKSVHDEASQARVEVKAQKQITKRAKVRSHVEQQTDQLPDAPIQRIGDASPDTAAGKLQDWTRD